MTKPTHVLVDKSNYKRKRNGKWRVGVVYKPKHGRVHLSSYKHKDDAQAAGHLLAKYFKVPVTIYSSTGMNSQTKDYR